MDKDNPSNPDVDRLPPSTLDRAIGERRRENREHHERRAQALAEQTYKLARCNKTVSVVGIIVVAAYTTIAAIQAGLLYSANKFTRIVLSGTQGAIVQPFNSLPRNLSTVTGTPDLEFTNTGKLSALDFSGNLSIAAIGLPKLQKIRVPTLCEFGGKGVSIAPLDSPISIPYAAHCYGISWTDKDEALIKSAQEAAVVKGSFSYLNGIDEKPTSVSFCWVWLDTSTIPNRFGLGSPDWFPRRLLPKIASIAAQAQKEEKQTNKATGLCRSQREFRVDPAGTPRDFTLAPLPMIRQGYSAALGSSASPHCLNSATLMN